MLTKTSNELFLELDPSTTIITPNRRLSATLHKLYQQYQLDQSHAHWLTPDILPAVSWFQRVYFQTVQTQNVSNGILLTPVQEQFLWESILANTPQSDQLLQPAETATMVKSAWGLIKQWRIDRQNPLFKTSEDYIAFQQWAAAFDQLCIERGWLDSASLPSIITQYIQSQRIALPKQLVLLGFTEITPELDHLLTCCRQSGVVIQQIELDEGNHHSQRISVSDDEAEMFAMARWAKSLLSKQTSVRIGCVVPSLEIKRDRVAQIFANVFAVDGAHTIDTQAAPFNISAGKSLNFYPIIHAALQILSLYKKTTSSEALSYLLATPFLGEAESEYIKRSVLDSLIRQKNINSLVLRDTLQEADNLIVAYCPQFAKRLTQFFTLLNEGVKKQTYQAWAHTFTQLLTAMGWPGQRSLISEEYQAVEQWLQLLSQLSALDYMSDVVDCHTALESLQRMAAKTVFQPKTPDAPIQVLGVLEAAALPFDYLWIAGMDDLSWPPQPNPNPFIPRSLQRELHMPHATPERELTFCQALIRQFQQSANEVIFSYGREKDEIEVECSPLIRHLPEISIDTLNLTDYQLPSLRIFQSRQLEKIQDEAAPALADNDKVQGGVDVIKQQALCPFKAFAQWRLHARELETTLPGLRPRERGKLLHKVLEIMWSTLQDHSTLTTLPEDTLRIMLDSSIEKAFLLVKPIYRTQNQYIELEKQRLHKLVWDWLQHEKHRPAFRVAINEESMTVRLNRLSLAMRIDRIDELSDGKKLMIDYKFFEIRNF